MAYVGTPIDTRNQFQSLQGKRFNGDGSTTAFTLDVAPSSTLDIEVFVGNVRQDPNSAYTLSGTTLTFTGAPPSGTNNIYVVHQAKAVGTITPPDSSITSDKLSGNLVTPGTFDVNGQELILDADADTSITADTDDQIDIKIAGADDFQFTANTFTAQSGSTITTPTLGVGLAKDLGVGLHIKTADCGGGTPGGGRDNLIIEDSGSTGMTIIGGASNDIGIAFGDSGNASIGMINYNNSSNYMQFNTNDAERMRILDDGAVKVVTSFFIETERDDTQKINVEFGGNAEGGILLNDKDAANNGTFVQFRRSNTQIGTIRRNGTSDAVSYNTSSDYRLKDGIVDLTGGIDTIKKLKPRKFYWKSDTDKTLIDGFIAHEVQDVAELSHAVTGIKDATRQITDGDGVTATEMDTQGLDYSKLVTYLTAALKESITKIESLEARVTTLEG